MRIVLHLECADAKLDYDGTFEGDTYQDDGVRAIAILTALVNSIAGYDTAAFNEYELYSNQPTNPKS